MGAGWGIDIGNITGTTAAVQPCLVMRRMEGRRPFKRPRQSAGHFGMPSMGTKRGFRHECRGSTHAVPGWIVHEIRHGAG